MIIIHCLHPSGRKEIMNLLFQSIFKDLIAKLFWFRLVSFGFVSFRFVEYDKPTLPSFRKQLALRHSQLGEEGMWNLRSI